MPWETPTLKTVRSLVRDAIRGNLPGADANIANSVLRVISDAMGALCHLTLQYLDWLALQLLPDTAETEWLDRHGDIWLVNADGTTGRKMATLAIGSANFIGDFPNVVVPQATQLSYSGVGMSYETTEEFTTGPTGVATPGNIRALDTGSLGNLDVGTELSVDNPPAGLEGIATVISLVGGTDQETDEELRARVLERIRKPPMGGDKDDYEQWALAVPGVTRAWCSPLEQGMGTVTLRFMMDDLRADNGGFPLPGDIDTVKAYLDSVRPVAVKDFWVESPIPYPIDVPIKSLDLDVEATRGAITTSLEEIFFENAAPGQTWFEAWTQLGILNASGVNTFHIPPGDTVMPDVGHMPVLGDITYA
jgi:uncharacterized phage protein gp47/JayE